MPLITSFAPSTRPRIRPSSFVKCSKLLRLSAHGTNNLIIDTASDITKSQLWNDTTLYMDREELATKFTTIDQQHHTHQNNDEAITTNNNNHPTHHTELPRHVAFICDGNSRWSKQHSLPKSMGHAAGADRVITLIQSLQQYQPGIQYCTLYAFSTENWARSSHEIETIFTLMERFARQYRSHESITGGRLQIDLLGDMEDERIPLGAKRELLRLQEESREACRRRNERLFGNNNNNKSNSNTNSDNNALTICLAINYGARADILQAAQKLAQAISSGEISPSDLTTLNESDISKRLCTAHIPDPDLIIRTSGETRLSNFLLWNAAYAELYFTDLLWPDFDEVALEEALVWYGKRKRRFGGRNNES